jgi:tetratricopeptide (TPR) repeat protein
LSTALRCGLLSNHVYLSASRAVLILLFPVIAGSIVIESYAQASGGGISELIESGGASFSAFDNEKAAGFYRLALVMDSTNYDALIGLARVKTTQAKDLLDEDRVKDAESLVRESVDLADTIARLFPSKAATQFQLAASYGNYALYRGGKAKLEIGRSVETYCLRAIELDPSFAPPYMVLGIFYREISELSWVERTVASTLFGGVPKGGKKKSEQYLQEALERDPNLVMAWDELGVTRLALNDMAGAEIAFRTAISLNPESTNDIASQKRAQQMLDKHF